MQARLAGSLVFCFLLLSVPGATTAARADEAADIEKLSRAALASLLQSSEDAKILNDEAAAVLVFPEVLKGGLIVAGLYGEGSLLKSEEVVGYYSTTSASIGLQAGRICSSRIRQIPAWAQPPWTSSSSGATRTSPKPGSSARPCASRADSQNAQRRLC